MLKRSEIENACDILKLQTDIQILKNHYSKINYLTFRTFFQPFLSQGQGQKLNVKTLNIALCWAQCYKTFYGN
jgi:hypothetical protein